MGAILSIESGDSKTYRLNAYRKDPLTGKEDTNNPIPLTGNRVRFLVFEGGDEDLGEAGVTPVIEKDSNNGPSEVEIVAVPNDNQALIKLLPADTILVEGDYHVKVLVIITASGAIHTVFKGILCVS